MRFVILGLVLGVVGYLFMGRFEPSAVAPQPLELRSHPYTAYNGEYIPMLQDLPIQERDNREPTNVEPNEWESF